MMTTAAQNWQTANQAYLMAALGQVRNDLSAYVKQSGRELPATIAPAHDVPLDHLATLAAAMSAPPGLDVLCTTFDLSPFERDLLLLCAGPELDATFSQLCALAQADAQRPYPTLSLALAALSNAHWDACTTSSPLRHWQFIELGEGPALTQCPLRINERMLHYLVGTPHVDAHLANFIDSLGAWGDLVPSHQALAERLAAVWSRVEDASGYPVIQLCGSDAVSNSVAERYL